MAMLSHRQGWSSIILLCIFPGFLYASTTSDVPTVTYRTGTTEVRVSFFATDQNERPVQTLSQDDFAVVDDGIVVRSFRSLARSNETALDVVLVMDSSASVASRFRQNTDNVLHLVSEEKLAPEDKVSVVTFAGLQPQLLCNLDCYTSAMEQKIQSVKATGLTPLFDTLAYTAALMAQRKASGGRQVIILFSDGNDTISRISGRDALAAINNSGALLYTINIDSSGPNFEGNAVLRHMAEATGGRSFSATEGAGNVVQAILDDLRNSYIVTYRIPSRTTGFHSLRILPKHNLNLRFHCRRGYDYEEAR